MRDQIDAFEKFDFKHELNEVPRLNERGDIACLVCTGLEGTTGK